MIHHICFELTMSKIPTWNGRWMGEYDPHYILYTCSEMEFEYNHNHLIGEWFYNWDDGWQARITGTEICLAEAEKRLAMRTCFCGYNWMVHSILKHGKIEYPETT